MLAHCPEARTTAFESPDAHNVHQLYLASTKRCLPHLACPVTMTTLPVVTVSFLTHPFWAPFPLPCCYPRFPPISALLIPSTFANSMSPGSVELSPLLSLPESSNSFNWKNSLSLCPSKLIISVSRGAWSSSGMCVHPALSSSRVPWGSTGVSSRMKEQQLRGRYTPPSSLTA